MLYTYQFPTSQSIVLFAVVLMGGIYTRLGRGRRRVLLQILPGAFTVWGISNDWATILFGVGVLQVLTTAPAGIAHQFPRDLAKLGGAALAWRGGSRRPAAARHDRGQRPHRPLRRRDAARLDERRRSSAAPAA